MKKLIRNFFLFAVKSPNFHHLQAAQDTQFTKEEVKAIVEGVEGVEGGASFSGPLEERDKREKKKKEFMKKLGETSRETSAALQRRLVLVEDLKRDPSFQRLLWVTEIFWYPEFSNLNLPHIYF